MINTVFPVTIFHISIIKKDLLGVIQPTFFSCLLVDRDLCIPSMQTAEGADRVAGRRVGECAGKY